MVQLSLPILCVPLIHLYLRGGEVERRVVSQTLNASQQDEAPLNAVILLSAVADRKTDLVLLHANLGNFRGLLSVEDRYL